ncbi:MAG: hypothetical protein HY898_24435 [Deltaproteobacteria bacterium]|nr:hypothetical protein [Deltaproteobacteria bacterium]
MFRGYAVSIALILGAVSSCSSDSFSNPGAAGSSHDAGGSGGDAGDGSAGKEAGLDAGGDVKDGAAGSKDAQSEDTGLPDAGPCVTDCERGQPLEGYDRASFDWFKLGAKAAVTFVSNRTGSIKEIGIPWRIDGGYGAGDTGVYSFELQTNGAGDFPSGNALASASNVSPPAAMGGKTDGLITVALSAVVSAGATYHLVVTHTGTDPAQNWSSLNTLMSPIVPWDGARSFGARIAFFDNGVWNPWSSEDNPWNVAMSNSVNGGHVALRIKWADDAVSGDPYAFSAVADPGVIGGTSKIGQLIVWNTKPIVIGKFGLAVAKEGTPGDLMWHLEKNGAPEVGTGVLAKASDIKAGSTPTWVTKNFVAPVTLEEGATYRLWFESPDSTAPNRYVVHPVYGPGDDPMWLETGWGGQDSCMIQSSGGAWNQQTAYDLSFSLRTQ